MTSLPSAIMLRYACKGIFLCVNLLSRVHSEGSHSAAGVVLFDRQQSKIESRPAIFFLKDLAEKDAAGVLFGGRRRRTSAARRSLAALLIY